MISIATIDDVADRSQAEPYLSRATILALNTAVAVLASALPPADGVRPTSLVLAPPMVITAIAIGCPLDRSHLIAHPA